MPSPNRRAMLAVRGGGGNQRDDGPQDITGPIYLTRPSFGARRARILTGRGTFEPGYRLVGTGPGGLDEGVRDIRVLKMVSPLTGQGPASPLATGRYYGLNFQVLRPRILRVQKAVSSSSFGVQKVVRPPRNAIRRLDTRGQGTVGYV